MADWSSLPADIIRLIAGKLSVVDDFASLSSVCRSYRYAADKNQWRPDGVPRPPWLLLSCEEDGGEVDNSPINQRGLLNMYKNKKKFIMDLPEIHGRRCWTSSHGWIVTLGLDRQLHLFNPLNRRSILLPQPDISGVVKDGLEESIWMRKVIIDRCILIKRHSSSYSSSAASGDFIVAATDHYGHLRVLRHDSWETVKFSFMGPKGTVGTTAGHIYDVARHNGQIYALGLRGCLFVCSGFEGSEDLIAKEYVPQDLKGTIIRGGEKLYLVEYFGDLLMVVRVYDWFDDCKPHYKTLGFETYKLNHDTKKWIQVEDLGDWALFVGNCELIPLPQPETMNCRRNCIYFTDDYHEQFSGIGGIGGHDMGIYDFEDVSIEPLYDGADSLSTYSTPNWLIPSFT